jgi:hypothetical protein
MTSEFQKIVAVPSRDHDYASIVASRARFDEFLLASEDLTRLDPEYASDGRRLV